jgi:hypothetical protein
MHIVLRNFIAGCLLVASFVQAAMAQSENSHDTPTKVSSRTQPPAQPSVTSPEIPSAPHAFWDKQNTLLFSGVGLFRALDYTSTKNMLARGREEILIPDDVVNSQAGFPALEAAGTAASIGISYFMHRTGHHKLERWVSIVHIGVTGFGAARNYALKSKHPVIP